MTPTQRWWWIRHAPTLHDEGTYVGRRDVPLNLPDIAPLELLSGMLPEQAAWLTSPLARCRETAERLTALKEGNAAPVTIDQFAEQDFGDWEGKTYQDIWDQHQAQYDWNDPASILPEGGESFAQVVSRAVTGINAVIGTTEARDIIVMSHAGVIRAAIAHALNLTPAQALHIHLDYLSLTCLDYYANPKGWVVRLINWAPLVGVWR